MPMDKKPTAQRADPESRRAYSRWHYRQHKDAYKERARIHKMNARIALQEFLLEYLKANPCVDCGNDDPVVLEFDHRCGTEKKFNIGDAARCGYSINSVISEIGKCDVRCANCHRKATYLRAGSTHKG